MSDNTNPTPTADQLANNPNPTEHVITDDNILTADEKVLEQQMNAAFEKRKQELQGDQPQPEEPQQPGLFVPEKSQEVQPTGDLSNQIEQAFPDAESTEQPQQAPTEQPPEEANDRVKYLQQVFKDTLGVDVGEAVQTMSNFNETAQGTISQMQEMENRMALQQQRLDLMYTWGQEAQQHGLTPSQLVDQRLGEATKVFSTLNEGLRKRIAAQGSKGIIDLYNLIQKNRGVQQQPQQPQMTVPTAGRANIATNPQGNSQQQQNLSSLISAKSDDDFWRGVREGYNDDLGVIRRR